MMHEDPVAEALQFVGRAIDRLGTADAATSMGGLEAHAVLIGERLASIASSLDGVAESGTLISLSLDEVAGAIVRVAEAIERGRHTTTEEA